MSQIDFLIIRAFADALVNSYTTYRFLKGKKKNMTKYNAKYGQGVVESDSETDDYPDNKQLVEVSTIKDAKKSVNDIQLDISTVTAPVTETRTPKTSPTTTPKGTPKVTPRSANLL